MNGASSSATCPTTVNGNVVSLVEAQTYTLLKQFELKIAAVLDVEDNANQ